MKSLPHVAARHLEQVVLVKLLENTSLQLDELKEKNEREKKGECGAKKWGSLTPSFVCSQKKARMDGWKPNSRPHLIHERRKKNLDCETGRV